MKLQNMTKNIFYFILVFTSIQSREKDYNIKKL